MPVPVTTNDVDDIASLCMHVRSILSEQGLCMQLHDHARIRARLQRVDDLVTRLRSELSRPRALPGESL